ncbi:MAG TPA: methylated-DNA--protein-cysteine methyltransferase [Micromonosporaceae bacterium]|nr:methylated-DNA--protein-cysteine methyltransferase [Micromonosporaceae bacterium]HCU50944.1 methylated-DNA--protein-cysteine methyltransferase [Micromonosporaceae bacterium]
MITISTPVGPFTMTGNGLAVTAARFGNSDSWPRSLASQRATSSSRLRAAGDLPRGDVPQSAVDAVKAYLDGDLTAIDTVPVAQSGTVYLEHCWDVLRTLDTPITYTEFAQLTGKPGAVRAAAQGCARNQIALLVPCHRVLRADGSLGGYRWGLDIKRWLLQHEANSY